MYITRICTGTCMHCTGMQLDCSGTATSLSHLNIVPVQKLCTSTVCFCDRFITCSSVTFFLTHTVMQLLSASDGIAVQSTNVKNQM